MLNSKTCIISIWPLLMPLDIGSGNSHHHSVHRLGRLLRSILVSLFNCVYYQVKHGKAKKH